MIVFGPIMILFSLGVLFILVDIFYNKEEPTSLNTDNIQKQVRWTSEYNEDDYLRDDWDENNQ